MSTDRIVIVGVTGTPAIAFQGGLEGFGAARRGAAAIRAAFEPAKIRAVEDDVVSTGCLLPVGRDQAAARQASLAAARSVAPAASTPRCRAGIERTSRWGKNDQRRSG